MGSYASVYGLFPNYFAIFIYDNRQQNIMESMKSMKHAIVSTYFKLKTTYNTQNFLACIADYVSKFEHLHEFIPGYTHLCICVLKLWYTTH